MDQKQNWELSKENIQPLSSGRRMANLMSSLDTTTEDQELLFKNKIKEFEDEISNFSGNDLLEPWIVYISFLEQAFVCNAKAQCIAVINRCVTTFLQNPIFKNDKRFVDILIKSISNIEPVNRVAILKNLFTSYKIGTGVSRMYITMAEDYESLKQYPKAIEVLNMGINEEASPIEYLHDALTQLQFRVAEKVSKDILEGKNAETRNFGCSVPLSGPDAPSVRSHLSPAEATQAKPASKIESKRFQLFANENAPAGEKNETTTTKVTSHFDNVRSDKENTLEPTKWNKPDNVILDKDEFHARTRTQNAIQVYVDESSTPIEKCRTQPQEGVLSDRIEPNDLKKPSQINTLTNVKIMYRKNQIYVDGKEITFEHFRAMEYRKNLKTDPPKATVNDSSPESNKNSIGLPEKEKEEYLKRIEEMDAMLQQFKKTSESERLQLLRLKDENALLENAYADLDSQKKEKETLLQDLEVSYHALKHETDEEREHFINKISNLEKKYDELYTFYEKQKQVEMANWKQEFYDQIQQAEQARLRKEFAEAKLVMASKYDEKTRELQDLLETQKIKLLDLENKLLSKDQQILALSKEMSCTVTESRYGQSNITSASVFQYENMSETKLNCSNTMDMSTAINSSANKMSCNTVTSYSNTDASKTNFISSSLCANNISTRNSTELPTTNENRTNENEPPQAIPAMAYEYNTNEKCPSQVSCVNFGYNTNENGPPATSSTNFGYKTNENAPPATSSTNFGYKTNENAPPASFSTNFGYKTNENGPPATSSTNFTYKTNENGPPASYSTNFGYKTNENGPPATSSTNFRYKTNENDPPATSSTNFGYKTNENDPPATSSTNFAYKTNENGPPATSSTNFAYKTNENGPPASYSTNFGYKTNENGPPATSSTNFGYKTNENGPPQPSVNLPALTSRSGTLMSSDPISQPTTVPTGNSQSFKLPPKFPAKKMKPFSLYESQIETLNLGNSTRANMSQMHSIFESDSYQKLPENLPINNALVTHGKENKDNFGSRKPLGCITTPAVPETGKQEYCEDKTYVYGNILDNTKPMDFNITNNLTRALAMNKPLLVSTPDMSEKGPVFRRPNPIIFDNSNEGSDGIHCQESKASTSIYVDIDDYEDDDDLLDEKVESRDQMRGNHLNFTEGAANPNLSTIQETSKENRSTYTSSSSGSYGNMTNMTRGYASGGISSLANFTTSGSVPPSASRLYNSQGFTSQNHRKSNYDN